MTAEHLTSSLEPLAALPPAVREALTANLPTRKERLIHRRVCIEGRFADEVAREHSQSPDRVQLTAASVQQWLVPVQADVDAHQTGALHLERLEHQWREAMAAWYRSGQQAEVVKVSFEGNKSRARETPVKRKVASAKTAKPDGKQKIERTTRGGCGDVHYLEQARRIMSEIRELTAAVEKMTQAERETNVAELTPDQRNASAIAGVVLLRERKDAHENRSAADQHADDDGAA